MSFLLTAWSSWLTATARKELTIRAALAAVAQFEDEHAGFTPDDLADPGHWADSHDRDRFTPVSGVMPSRKPGRPARMTR